MLVDVAVKVAVCPKHTPVGALTLTVGTGLIGMVRVLILLQPKASVPVTVYVVVTVGVIMIGLLVEPSFVQV